MKINANQFLQLKKSNILYYCHWYYKKSGTPAELLYQTSAVQKFGNFFFFFLILGLSQTVQLLSKEKCFQLLLAWDLSSKRFVKHWLGYPSSQNGKNKLHSDCEWTRNDTATDDKSSGSLSRMNSGRQESGRRLTGCPPHQRWLSFSRLLRVNVASKTGSYMEFPTIPWDSG